MARFAVVRLGFELFAADQSALVFVACSQATSVPSASALELVDQASVAELAQVAAATAALMLEMVVVLPAVVPAVLPAVPGVSEMLQVAVAARRSVLGELPAAVAPCLEH